MPINIGGVTFTISGIIDPNISAQISSLAAMLKRATADMASISTKSNQAFGKVDASKLRDAGNQLAKMGTSAHGAASGLSQMADAAERYTRTNLSAAITRDTIAMQQATASAINYANALGRASGAQQRLSSTPSTSGPPTPTTVPRNTTTPTPPAVPGFVSTAQGLSTSLVMIGSALGGAKLAELIKEATLYAGRLDVLKTVMYQVGSNSYYTRTQLNSLESGVKRLGITTEASRSALILLARNDLDVARSAQLARIAQDAAVIAGTNSSEALEKMALSVQRLDTRMLKNQGIVVNLRNEYQKMALQTGRTENSFSAAERQQMLMNAVLRAGVNIYGSYEAAMTQAHKQYLSLQRYQDEALKTLGEQFQGIFSSAVKGATEALKWWEQSSDVTKELTAAVLAMGAAFLLALPAIGAVAAVVAALGTAAAPFVLTALAISAAVGVAAGGFTLFSASAENARRSLEKQSEAAAASMQKLLDTKKVLQELGGFASISKLTAVQQDELNATIEKAITLFPEYSESLRSASGNIRGVMALLRGISPDLALTPKQLLDKQVTDQEEAINRAVAIARESVKTHPHAEVRNRTDEQWRKQVEGDVAGTNELSTILLHRYQAAYDEQIRIAREAIAKERVLEQAYDYDKLRTYDDMSKQQETASNMALKVLERYHKERVKLAKSANLEIQADFDEAMSNLSRSVMTETEIMDQAATALRVKMREIRENAQKERLKEGISVIDPKSKEEQAVSGKAQEFGEAIRKQQDAERNAVKQIEADAATAFQNRQNVLLANETKLKEIQDRITDTVKDNQLISQENDLLAVGLDTHTAKMLSEAQKLADARKKAAEQFNERMSGAPENDETRILELEQTKLRLQLAFNGLGEEENKIAKERLAIVSRELEAREGGYEARQRQLKADAELAEARLRIDPLDVDAIRMKESALREMEALENQIAANRRNDAANLEDTVLKQEKFLTEFQEHRRKEEEKTQEELTRIEDAKLKLSEDRKRVLDQEIKTYESMRTELKKLSEETKQHHEAVADFIENQKAIAVDKMLPGFSKVRSEFQKFKTELGKATTEAQISDLSKTYRFALSGVMEEVETNIRESYRNASAAQRDLQVATMRAYSQMQGGRYGLAGNDQFLSALEKYQEAAGKHQQNIDRLRTLRGAGNESLKAMDELAKANVERLKKETDHRSKLQKETDEAQKRELKFLDDKEAKLATEKAHADAMSAKLKERKTGEDAILDSIRARIAAQKEELEVKSRLVGDGAGAKVPDPIIAQLKKDIADLKAQIVANQKKQPGLMELGNQEQAELTKNSERRQAGEISENEHIDNVTKIQNKYRQKRSVLAESQAIADQAKRDQAQPVQGAQGGPGVADDVHAPLITTTVDRPRATLTPDQEKQFQHWWDNHPAVSAWKGALARDGGAPDVDDPNYDYRAAWKAGVVPQAVEDDTVPHWPSEFKGANHPNRFVEQDGQTIDTITGQAVSKHEADLARIKAKLSETHRTNEEQRQATLDRLRSMAALDHNANEANRIATLERIRQRNARIARSFAEAPDAFGMSQGAESAIFAYDAQREFANRPGKPAPTDEQERLRGFRLERGQAYRNWRLGRRTEVDQATDSRFHDSQDSRRILQEAYARFGRRGVQDLNAGIVPTTPFSGGMGGRMVGGDVVNRQRQATQALADASDELKALWGQVGNEFGSLTATCNELRQAASEERKKYGQAAADARNAVRGLP